jgi:hypothetical protein
MIRAHPYSVPMNMSPVRHGRTHPGIAGHRPGHRAATRWLLTVGLIAELASRFVAEGATATLAWDPPTNNVDGTSLTDLAGFNVHYGTDSQFYLSAVDVGPVTTATVTNLSEGVTYFFAVTCYNASGAESGFSEELAWTSAVSSFVDHFVWGPIASPQTSGVPFPATVTAKDSNDVTVAAFAGTVRLGSAVAITPTNSSGFVNGVWSGVVTVLAGATNLTLTATDGGGHSGTSAAFRSDVRLTVSSVRGGASPGTVTANYGAALSQWVTNSPVSAGTTQFVCSGATVLGNAFTLVSPTNVTLTLTNNATLTWQWAQRFYLALAVNGSGTVDRSSGWYASGTTSTVTATAAPNWGFTSWSGDTNGCTIVGNRIAVPMNKPRAITARFAANSVAVDHFAWGPIASPQTSGVPFLVTVTARDTNNATVAAFGGTVNLSGLTNSAATIGTATAVDDPPLGTTYDTGRTQALYLTNEVGRSGWITALALHVSAAPGQTLKNWTLRLKHTPLSFIAYGSTWESNGWTTVYRKDTTVTATGWVTFAFSSPFYYNGTNNLMVDFSFRNTNHTSLAGSCRQTTVSSVRKVSGQANGTTYGDPRNWSGSKPAPNGNRLLPDLQLLIGSPAAITPAKSYGFVNGVWVGSVTVANPTTNLVLLADDGAGHSGPGNAIRVVGVASAAAPSPPEDLGGGDSAPVLRLNLSSLPTGVDETGVVVEWTSVTGRYYTVERSTDLMAVPAFTKIVGQVPGLSPFTAYTDMTATGSGPYYYRVQEEP